MRRSRKGSRAESVRKVDDATRRGSGAGDPRREGSHSVMEVEPHSPVRYGGQTPGKGWRSRAGLTESSHARRDPRVPGFDELDAFGPLEVLRDAARHDGELEVAVVSMDGVSVTGSHGVTVEVDHPVSESSDLLVVPGGGWNDRSPAGVRAEIDRGTIPEALSAAHQSDTTVAGVCTGELLLAAGAHQRPASHYASRRGRGPTGQRRSTDPSPGGRRRGHRRGWLSNCGSGSSALGK